MQTFGAAFNENVLATIFFLCYFLRKYLQSQGMLNFIAGMQPYAEAMHKAAYFKNLRNQLMMFIFYILFKAFLPL